MITLTLLPILLWQAAGDAAPPAAEKIDFEKQIRPLFAENCYRCHGPSKEKGKLRLDLKAGILRDESVIVPGKPDDSELYYRVTLPCDDGDAMPPEGEGDGLTTEQAELIKKWIEQGADFGAWTRDESAGESLPTVPPAAPEALAALRKSGATVEPLARHTNLLRVAFPSASQATDAQLALLAPVKEQVAWLSLVGSGVTDAGLAPLRELKNLRRLDLSATPIGDDALAHLGALPELRTLILNETKVSDAGLVHLKKLPNLRTLYAWKTRVTESGASSLAKQIEDLDVILDVD